MAEELQSLLEKINEEGVRKAEDAKNKIISEAKAQAEKIVSEAEAKAESIVRNANEAADTVKSRGEAAVRQAVRDITIALQQELLSRLRNVVKSSTGEAMTPELMGRIILEMAKNYSAKGSGAESGIEIVLSQKDRDSMEAQLRSELVSSLRKTPVITLGQNFSSGLKISFKDNDVFFDFSDEAISEIICAYVGPRLASIINSDKKK